MSYSITSIRRQLWRYFLIFLLRPERLGIPSRVPTTREIVGVGMTSILLLVILISSGCGIAPLPRIGIETRAGIARAMKPGECRPSAPCRKAVYLREGWRILPPPAKAAGLYEWTGIRCARHGSTKSRYLPAQVPCLPTR